MAGVRQKTGWLALICGALILSIWIDKGMGMVVTGFVPSVNGAITEYAPTFPEVMITLGVYAVGALILTVLHKVAVGIREAEMV